MKIPPPLQHIAPVRNIFFAGETVSFHLSGIPESLRGRAVVRTNIGGAAKRRREIIGFTENNKHIRNSDWHDIEMLPGQETGTFSLTLPLPETGVFEAKCCFLPENNAPALWPASGNFQLKVEPPEYEDASNSQSGCGDKFQHSRLSVSIGDGFQDTHHIPPTPLLPHRYQNLQAFKSLM